MIIILFIDAKDYSGEERIVNLQEDLKGIECDNKSKEFNIKNTYRLIVWCTLNNGVSIDINFINSNKLNFALGSNNCGFNMDLNTNDKVLILISHYKVSRHEGYNQIQFNGNKIENDIPILYANLDGWEDGKKPLKLNTDPNIFVSSIGNFNNFGQSFH